MTASQLYTTIFMVMVFLAVSINFVLLPMLEDIYEQAEYSSISVGRVSSTNSTGNNTAEYNVTAIGLFGDPQSQLTTVLIILGVAVVVASVAVFGTGAQPGPAAVAAFLVALALIIVNVLVAAMPVITDIPVIGTPIFIILVGLVTVSTLYVAAGFMASGSAH